MSVSDVGICNSALIKIGASRINSLADNNKAAIICSEQYTKLRDEVLRSHPWNFAIKRAALGALVTPPAYEWLTAFQLPGDCLRVIETQYDEPYTVEGRSLLANVTTINIRYIAQIVDPTLFDSIFQEALALRIAADLSTAITNSQPMQDRMFAAYKEQLRLARSMDAQEGTPEDENPTIWAQVRR